MRMLTCVLCPCFANVYGSFFICACMYTGTCENAVYIFKCSPTWFLAQVSLLSGVRIGLPRVLSLIGAASRHKVLHHHEPVSVAASNPHARGRRLKVRNQQLSHTLHLCPFEENRSA